MLFEKDSFSSPVTIVTASGYVRDHLGFSRADHFGADVAQHDLETAALRFTPAELQFLTEFSPQPASLAGVSTMADDCTLDELQGEYPGRVHIGRVTDLRALLEQKRLVYLAGGPEFWPVAQLRHSVSRPLPICSILHASNWPHLLFSYANMLLTAEPYDVLVATSTAGLTVAERAIELARRYLAERMALSAAAVMRMQVRTAQIPLAVDAGFLSPRNKEECRHLLGIPAQAKVLLYIGRLSEGYKADLEPLLCLFRRISTEDPNTLLVLAGQDTEGLYSKSLKRLAASLGLGDRVRLLPNFPYFLKPMLYSAADIFVSPSDNIQETFGLSILEAMACGLPVVASDWSGYRDLVADGQTGYLIKTYWNPTASSCVSNFAAVDKGVRSEHYLAQRTFLDIEQMKASIETLLGDADRRRVFGERGRARVLDYFNWPTVARLFYELWEEQRQIQANLRRPGAGFHWVDYDFLYRHFATEAIDLNLSMTCADPAGMKSLVQGYPGRYPSQQVRRMVTHTLARCGPVPVTLAETKRYGDAETAEAAMSWLLKRGVCQVTKAHARSMEMPVAPAEDVETEPETQVAAAGD